MRRAPQPLRVGPALAPRPSGSHPHAHASRIALPAIRAWMMHAAIASVFALIGAQTVRLAASGTPETRISRAEPLNHIFVRPDIVDRRGNLIAADVVADSLFADPAIIRDADEAAEKLAALFPDLDARELRPVFADKSRRFAWVKRGLTPIEAQRAFDLGIPGLGFRREPRRIYPTRFLTYHVVGQVDVDNRGLSGIERHIDEAGEAESAAAPMPSRKPPVRLSIDLGVQNAMSETLGHAMGQYQAQAAAGTLMDAESGEVIAAVSLPDQDPARFKDAGDDDRFDRVTGGVFELGSIAKIATLGLAYDDLGASPTRFYDTRQPLRFGRHTIAEQYPPGRPLTLAEILIRSSNVGAGIVAMEAGVDRQRAFLDRLGLLDTIRTEAGRVAPPLLPSNWGPLEGVTISYGHGLAVAPLQFAAATASLVNGDIKVRPTFIRQDAVPRGEARVVSPETSAAIRDALRRAVTEAQGTGGRADLAGYEIGGKTGTAEQPGRGGYRSKTVISSFLAVLPARAPRYVLLVSLFEPQGVKETKGRITAGLNAAPTAARIVARIGPMLDLIPPAKGAK